MPLLLLAATEAITSFGWLKKWKRAVELERREPTLSLRLHFPLFQSFFSFSTSRQRLSASRTAVHRILLSPRGKSLAMPSSSVPLMLSVSQ